MELAVLAILAALVALTTAGAVYLAGKALAYRAERVVWEDKTARRVVVSLKSGAAVDGILIGHSADMLTIREAVLHTPGADNPAPIDGEVVVLRDEVEYLQYPTTL